MTPRQLTLTDGSIAYDVIGQPAGPLVVCVHGLGDTRASYRFLAPALAATGHRVATMDVRGHGDSSADWPAYSTPAVADDITALIHHLGGPAVVVGHSFAAGSAAMVAERSPELVEGLVMLGPAVHHPPMGFFIRQMARLVASSPLLWTRYYASLHPGAKPADFREYTTGLKTKLRRPGRMLPVRRLLESFSPDTDAELSRVTTPTTIIMGGRDDDFDDPSAEAARIRDELAGPGTVHVLKTSGHYPHVDDAKATNTIVNDFLAK